MSKLAVLMFGWKVLRCLLSCSFSHSFWQVARLFDSLSASSAVACSQVLCVSHNAAFQQLCSRVVRLTRGSGGTTPADGGGTGRSGGKPSAAAGRSKKARKG